MGIRKTIRRVLNCTSCNGVIRAGTDYFWEKQRAKAYHVACRPTWTLPLSLLGK